MSQSLQFVWGRISKDRTPTQGSGFTLSDKIANGLYGIVFDPGTFSNPPVVTATCEVSSGQPDGFTFNLLSVDESQFEGKIRSSYSQDEEDQAFSFIAIGTP
jgi:hypothetical protein